MKMKAFVLGSAMLLALTACQYKSEDTGDEVSARLKDKVLTRTEVLERMPANYFAEDSAEVAQAIIANWVRDVALLDYAESNLTEEQKDFSKQLTDYRNSLVIYAYERELINQKLDTLVGDSEIRTYYESNVSNFKLQSYIVKARFIKISSDAPKQDKVEKWFQSDDEKDFEKLFEYCTKYAENYYFKDEDWLYLEDLMKEVPMPSSEWDNFLRQNSYYKMESGAFTYLVRFFAYKLKDDTSPLSFERGRIRDLILNRRKVELINQMRDDVVRKAYQNQLVEISKN